MATIVSAAGGGNWTATGTWVGGVVPTSADDVQLNGSGGVTINGAASCRSLDCTTYTGTLTHQSSVTLSIGDATVGLSNIALKMVSGMTYTLGSTTTSAISFVSTSSTTQTITTGGKALGPWTVNGAGSSYQLADANSAAGSSTTTVTLTAGTLNTNGQTCTWGIFSSINSNVRTLTLGSSSITITGSWSCATATNMTLNANTSTITFSGSNGSINSGTNLSYNTVVFTGAGSCDITSSGGVGTGTFANLTRTGTAVKTDELLINTAIVITGNLTLNGNSVTNRLLFASNIGGNARTITVNGSVIASNLDIRDLVGAGSASWNLSGITGNSGDCGATTGITFTTPATQTWQGTSSGNWSDNTKWTSRVPLPQDTVTINAAFSASQTVTADMPRLGKNIDWTGATGSPTWSLTSGSNICTIFGSLTLASGMTVSSASATLYFRGHGSFTVTTNGVTLGLPVAFGAGTGSTYTLQDTFTTSSALNVGISTSTIGGTLNTNGQTITAATVQAINLGSILTLGTSTVNLTSTAAGTIFSIVTASGNSPTLNSGTSTIVIVNTSANDRSIQAHGYTLSTLTYTVAGSTGRLILGVSGATGTLTIGTLNFSDATNARTLTLWSSTTINIGSAFNVQGTAGKLMTINASTSSTAATLTRVSGYTVCDYLSIQDSTATGGAGWYAGANSVSVSNNSGWIFTAAPTVLSTSKFMLFI